MSTRHLALGALLALAVAAAGLALASSGARHSAGRATLNAASFSTSYEPGWWLTTTVLPRGDYLYELTSSRARVDALGIPPAGTVAITIHEAPVSFLPAALLGAKGPTPSALELLPSLAGVPSGAREVIHTRARRGTLAGAEAGEQSHAYAYGARRNVQVDVLAEHGGHVVLVQLDAEPRLAAQARAALATVTRAWTWR
jgi:hypothetical protein